MAIPHASSGQVVDLRGADGSLPTPKSFALFKGAHLEVMRLVLPAGKSFPPHRVAGEITVQCLSGRLEVSVDGAAQVLAAGQLMYVAGNVLHGLTGLEDATALVTIVLSGP